jgi:hypothetical protein
MLQPEGMVNQNRGLRILLCSVVAFRRRAIEASPELNLGCNGRNPITIGVATNRHTKALERFEKRILVVLRQK